jgi:predicted nucleic acid-binding protein
MSAEAAVYLDSSALVKLVVQEPESAALAARLRRDEERASCALARVEVVRAVRAHGPGAVTRARQLLERVSLVHLDDMLLDDAAELQGDELRSLDAIHLAAARALGDGLAELITYNRRMAAAARALSLPTGAPA